MVAFEQLTVLCLAILNAASAFPTSAKPSRPCRNPPKRLEWREMPLDQRKQYLDAVLCLSNKPAISGVNGTVHRYDDHVAVHNLQTPNIHFVGHFLLWHRYFVATFEKALREECGYEGGQPYWNWSLDAQPQNPNSTIPFETEVFSPTVGFGGNGIFVPERTPQQNPFNLIGGTGGGCVQDGPFVPSAFMLNFPARTCLKRDFIPWILNTFSDPKLVDGVMAQENYTSFARELEQIPSFAVPNIHAGGHFGVGGVLGSMGSAPNSPGDPLFWLHHGNLDHIFWQWQQKDLKTRLNQVGGPVKRLDFGGQNVTLDFKINMGPLGGDVTLKDLLNTEGMALCYTY